MSKPLSLLFLYAPLEAIPTATQRGANLLLEKLSDCKPHSREEIAKLLGANYRSPLQALKGERFKFWLIHSVEQDNSKATFLQLDPRHRSADPEQDIAARLERRKQLKQESYKEAQQGWKRMPKAHTAMLEADRAYFQSLGGAANDETGTNNHD